MRLRVCILGDLCLGDAGEGADDTDDIAVGSGDGTGFHAEPVIIRAAGVQAEFLIDPPASPLDQCIETGAETILLSWMQHAEPRRGRPFERAAGKSTSSTSKAKTFRLAHSLAG